MITISMPHGLLTLEPDAITIELETSRTFPAPERGKPLRPRASLTVGEMRELMDSDRDGMRALIERWLYDYEVRAVHLPPWDHDAMAALFARLGGEQ